MVVYQVLINSIEYPFSSLEYKRSYSLTAQPFTVILPVVETIGSLQIVQIKRDGDVVYAGKIYEIGKTVDPKKGTQFVLKGFDYKHKLPFLDAVGEEYGELWGRPSGTDLTSHLRDQLTSSDLSEGTFNNTTKTYPIIFGTPNAKFNRQQAIRAIIETTGWEFFDNPDATCDFKSQIQTDRTSSIRFNRGELLVKWVKPFTLKASHKVEKITVTGHNIGDLMAQGSAELGGYVAGDREKTISFRHIKTDAAADDAATALLADWQNDVYYGKFQAVDTFEGRAYDIGDLIHVEDDKFSVDDNYRVASISKKFGGGSCEDTQIEITNISKLSLNAPFLLRGGEKGLIDSYMGVDSLGKVHHFSDTRTLNRWLLETNLFNDPFWRYDTNVWNSTLVNGAISASSDAGLPCLNLKVNAGAGGSAIARSLNAFFGSSTWRMSFNARTAANNTLLQFEIGAWYQSGANVYQILFRYETDQKLYASCKNGGAGALTEVDLGDWSGDITSYNKYTVERAGANSAKFYINDELETEITTNVPATDMRFSIYLYDGGVAGQDAYVRTVNAQELK